MRPRAVRVVCEDGGEGGSNSRPALMPTAFEARAIRRTKIRSERLMRTKNGRWRRQSGRGDWIRTSDPLLPKQMRYQAALRPDFIDHTPGGETTLRLQASGLRLQASGV